MSIGKYISYQKYEKGNKLRKELCKEKMKKENSKGCCTINSNQKQEIFISIRKYISYQK